MTDEPRSRAEEYEQHLVELTTTTSAWEADALAARLRKAGIVAIANATPELRKAGRNGNLLSATFRPFVVVLAADLDRAHEFLAAEFPPEGDATVEEIERALAADADDDEDAAGGDLDPLAAPATDLAARLATAAVILLVLGLATGIALLLL